MLTNMDIKMKDNAAPGLILYHINKKHASKSIQEAKLSNNYGTAYTKLCKTVINKIVEYERYNENSDEFN